MTTKGGDLRKVSQVVLDTMEAERARAERAERVYQHLRLSEQERGRFANVFEMLGFFFSMREHMASAPAIDPSREQIQGGTKADRDERIAWLGKIHRALEQLAIAQGSHAKPNPHNVRLLYLRFRVPYPTGTKVVDGRRVTRWTEGGVAIRELYEHDSLGRSRDKVIAAFWEAVEELETYCLNQNWVRERMERKKRDEQVYRRKPTNREGR